MSNITKNDTKSQTIPHTNSSGSNMVEEVFKRTYSFKHQDNFFAQTFFLKYKNQDLEEEYLFFLFGGKKSIFIRVGVIMCLLVGIIVLVNESLQDKNLLESNYPMETFFGHILGLSIRGFHVVIALILIVLTNIPCIYENKILLERILSFVLMLVLVTMLGRVILVFQVIIFVALILFISFLKVRFHVYLSVIVLLLVFSLFFNVLLFFSNGYALQEQIYEYVTRNVRFFFNGVILLVNVYYMEAHIRVIFEQKKKMKISQEKIKVEWRREIKILENIFPQNIIPHLRKKEKISQDHHDDQVKFTTLSHIKDPFVLKYNNVATLMLDIVEFTRFSSQHTSKFLIQILNLVYSKFDSIVIKYDLEKIKTIGDAFYSVSLKNQKSGALRSVLCAMEMRKEFEKISKFHNTGLKVRIGVGNGLAFLVVIGVDLLTFDCFGPSVEESVIMEATSVADRIQVSSSVYENTKSIFEYEKNNEGKGFFVKFKKKKIENVSVSLSDDDLDVENESENLPNNVSGEQYEKKDVFVKVEKRWKMQTYLLKFKLWKDNILYMKESWCSCKPYWKACLFIIFVCHTECIFLLSFLNLGGFTVCLYILITLDVSFLIVCIMLWIFPAKLVISMLITMMILFYNFTLGFLMTFICHSINEFRTIQYIYILTTFSGMILPNTHMIMKLMMVVSVPMMNIMIVMMRRDFSFTFFTSIDGFGVWINFCIVLFGVSFGFFDYHRLSLVAFKEKKLLEEQNKKLENERKLNEKLLQSSLPGPIIKKMMQRIKIKHDTVKEGCVLFCKIKKFKVLESNFTKLLSFLNEIFTNFDSITLRSGKCWKIKSHFSNYLVVNGISQQEENDEISTLNDNKNSILNYSLEMMNCGRRIITKHKFEKILVFTIGLHCGTWSTGIVGKSKFLYDCFGDTINVSARLAETAENNCIQVSEEFTNEYMNTSLTMDSVEMENNVNYTKRNVELKGKGRVTTYYVNKKEKLK